MHSFIGIQRDLSIRYQAGAMSAGLCEDPGQQHDQSLGRHALDAVSQI
jgi:hypothetical protein